MLKKNVMRVWGSPTTVNMRVAQRLGKHPDTEKRIQDKWYCSEERSNLADSSVGGCIRGQHTNKAVDQWFSTTDVLGAPSGSAEVMGVPIHLGWGVIGWLQ